LPGDVEREQIEPCLLGDYLGRHDPDYAQRVVPLVTIKVNGVDISFYEWAEFMLRAGDIVDIQLEPLGIEIGFLGWLLIGVTAVASAYAIYLASQVPDNIGATSRATGSNIYRADLQANTPKKNGTIPEIFGKMPRYPDLITPIHRKFFGDKEFIYVGLAVGVGQYSIAEADMRIGETLISNYSDDVSYDIVLPGASVTAITAAEHWYTSKEVGSTSGTSGLQLVGDNDVTADASYIYTYSGTTITQTDSASPPAAVDWDLVAGDRFRVADTTSNDGYYEVSSVTTNVVTAFKLRLVSITWYGLTVTFDEIWTADTSWTAFVTETAVATTVSYAGPNGDWSNWVNVLPEGETTQYIEIDIRYRRGIGLYDDSGDLGEHSLEIEYETRPVGGSSTSATVTKTDTTPDELADTVTVDLGSAIEPQIRFRRVTKEFNDSKYLEDVEIVRVKGKLTAAASYADVTTAFFEIRTTNAITQAAEKKLNMDVQRLLPTAAVYKTWADAGATGTPTHSAHSEIAAPVIYLTLDSGYAVSDIDIDTLTTLQTTWTSRADTFNAEISEESTLFELQQRILIAGYAEPTIEGGKITAKRDVTRTTYDYIYTPDKIMAPGITRPGTFYDPDENDGVEVEYFDRDTRQNEVVYYTLAAAGDTANPVNPKRVRAFGITDATKAWRFGSIDRRRTHYKPDQINFSTEMDGLNSTYLSSPAVADEMLVTGQSGRMVSSDGANAYTLDQALVFGAGTYKIAFSAADGTMSTLYTATAGATAYQVTLSSALDITPVLDGTQEAPLFAFGLADEWAQHVIVRDIQPQGDDTVKLICEEYISEIWDDIDNAPS